MLEKQEKKINKKVAKTTKYVALKTTSVYCNQKVKLVKGEEVSPVVGKDFLNSLINSNLIKKL